VIVVLKRNVK